jgi:hypothetical protein
MQKNLVLRRQEQWYIIPCAGHEQEILLTILEKEREDFDPQQQDIYACLSDLGWQIEFASTFAA